MTMTKLNSDEYRKKLRISEALNICKTKNLILKQIGLQTLFVQKGE